MQTLHSLDCRVPNYDRRMFIRLHQSGLYFDQDVQFCRVEAQAWQQTWGLFHKTSQLRKLQILNLGTNFDRLKNICI